MGDQRIRELERSMASGAGGARALLAEYRRAGLKKKYLEHRASLGYAVEVESLPVPTAEQTEAFVWYVQSAHSWYKHLAREAPSQFVFYLDPHVMMLLRDGKRPVEANKRNYDFFHYSDMSTRPYRKKFGYWNYHVIGRARDLSITSASGERLEVPGLLAARGTALVTAYMYGHKPPPDSPVAKLAPDANDYQRRFYNDNNEMLRQHSLMVEACNRFLAELRKEQEEI